MRGRSALFAPKMPFALRPPSRRVPLFQVNSRIAVVAYLRRPPTLTLADKYGITRFG